MERHHESGGVGDHLLASANNKDPEVTMPRTNSADSQVIRGRIRQAVESGWCSRGEGGHPRKWRGQ